MTDEAGPRLSGSPGNKVAVAWALGAMRAGGLVKVHAEPCAVPHWERGDERGEIVEPSPQPLALAALGGSIGTPPEGIEADVVEAPSLEGVDALGPAAAGKIVFIDVHMDRTRDGSGYGRAVPARGQGAIRAARLGAAAVLVRSIGTDDNRAPHTGAMRYDEKVPQIPAAALAIPDADVLHRLLAQGRRVRVRLKLGARSLPDAEGANVVGDVEGSAAPGEIVLLGAHLDSWDVGRGAIDDGAGCAIVMEAARQIARLAAAPAAHGAGGALRQRGERPPRRARVRRGARGRARRPRGRARGRPRGGPGLRDALPRPRRRRARVSRGRRRRRAARRAASDEEAHGGSDLIPLLAAGVPVLDLRQDATSYFDFHHTANDTMERIRKEDLDQAAAAFTAAAYAAADAPEALRARPGGQARPRLRSGRRRRGRRDGAEVEAAGVLVARVLAVPDDLDADGRRGREHVRAVVARRRGPGARCRSRS